MMMYGEDAARAALARSEGASNARGRAMFRHLCLGAPIVRKGGFYRAGDNTWNMDTQKLNRGPIGTIIVTCTDPAAFGQFVHSAREAGYSVVRGSAKDTAFITVRP